MCTCTCNYKIMQAWRQCVWIQIKLQAWFIWKGTDVGKGAIDGESEATLNRKRKESDSTKNLNMYDIYTF